MLRILKIILHTFPRPFLIKMSYWARPFLYLWYKGGAYTDPIDGRSFKKFLPYGYEVQRPNALSPSTLSLERHRLLWLYLQKETDFFTAQKKVLHIAPEQCFFKRFKKLPNLEYISTDLHSPLVDIKADICDLPFDDESFDMVLCNHVLEHIPDDKKAMSELYRILKKGGIGIFQIPQDTSKATTYEDFSITSPEERAKHFGQYDHVRVYGLDYFDKLRAIGFDVREVHFSKTLSSNLLKKYGLVKDEILPICFK